MANQKVSEMAPVETLTGAEIIPLVKGGFNQTATSKQIADLAKVMPILTDYPTTDATKAGTRFWYKGNEWHYMTQAEIDSLGWTGLVGIGFPAPVSKLVFNIGIVLGEYLLQTNSNSSSMFYSVSAASEMNFLGFGNPTKIKQLKNMYPINIAASVLASGLIFRNVCLLSNLEDIAGSPNIYAVDFNNFKLSAAQIDSFFTQLPATNKTATIDVRSTLGAATCDQTIATAKGYIVIKA